MSARAFIGIGSNLGDRLAHCRTAVHRLGLLPGTTVTRVSPFFEFEPREGVGGGRFLNAVADIATHLSPRGLLSHLQEIEAALGRPADHESMSARTMDLDILLYGDRIVREPDLTIPHPRMARRRFVLAPLVAIAPEIRHPVLKVTAADLLHQLGPESTAVPVGVRH